MILSIADEYNLFQKLFAKVNLKLIYLKMGHEITPDQIEVDGFFEIPV